MNDGGETLDDESILTVQSELLWRNAHPDWIVDGNLTSQAFRPTPKDQKKLSSARESKVTVEDNYEEYTERFGLTSAGVWAVSVEEVSQQRLRSIYDEHSDSSPSPCLTGHTSIDFTSLTGNQAKRVAGRLRDQAEERGKQHP